MPFFFFFFWFFNKSFYKIFFNFWNVLHAKKNNRVKFTSEI